MQTFYLYKKKKNCTYKHHKHQTFDADFYTLEKKMFLLLGLFFNK